MVTLPAKLHSAAAALQKPELNRLLLFITASHTRHGVIRFALQQPSILFLVHTAPLLEEEGRIVMVAVVSYFAYPCFIHGACAGSGFTADDDPINGMQVQVEHGTDERFAGNEF